MELGQEEVAREARGTRTTRPRLRVVSLRELGLLYDSSLMADDEPYELLEDGEPTGVVELPVEWIRDDAVYYGMDRASALPCSRTWRGSTRST